MKAHLITLGLFAICACGRVDSSDVAERHLPLNNGSEEAIASYRTEAIPASQILAAARELLPPTGPAYVVQGDLNCTQVVSEIPPYATDSSCSVTIDRRSAAVRNPQEILEVLGSKVKPITGPVYSFSGKFRATSITSEMPPFPTTEDAEVLVALILPAEKILDAARIIKPQSNPSYVVDGKLVCNQIHDEFPPYAIARSCQIEVAGELAEVEGAKELLDVLQTIYPITGPYYAVEGKFRAQSIAFEVPPYGAEESAEITLFW
jgi:hypothetical protein